MRSVVFQGPVLTQSGYGVHARQVASWLLQRQDLDVRFILTPWGDTSWVLNPNHFDGLAGEIMKRTRKPEGPKADVSIQLQLPNEWNPGLAHKNIGMTAVVETDRCLPSWVDACNAMNAVIVPSQHSASCLSSSGKLAQPVKVVPEAYSPAVTDASLPSLPDFSSPFNFLIFGQLTGNNPHADRKNIFYTVKWLCETFKDDPDVGIVIKTNAGRNSRIDRNMVTNLMKQLLSEVRKGPFPKVHLLHGDMNDKEVAALYRHPQVKALVALTRGEGFGLPILEAAASGLPVIATGWSGHLDFLKQGKYINVTYQLGEIHPTRVDDRIFVKGARWANPSEEDFKRKITKFRTSPTIPKEWATGLAQKLTQSHDLRAIYPSYDAVLEGLG